MNDNRVEVLVSTMHQSDHSLLDKMNIQSDAVVINQCDEFKSEKFEFKGNRIKFFSFAERGVGLSRNTALGLSENEICLFADDDVTYVDNYQEIISNAFSNSDADMIIFNVESVNPKRRGYTITKHKRLNRFNSMRYGTFRIAVRARSVKHKNIQFSLLFGGGARYSSGEDSIFISEFFKKGLKVYADPINIGYVDHQESTWFHGYTDKYFFDKGAFYGALSKNLAKLFCVQFVFRHYKKFQKDKTRREALRLMIEGTKEF